MFLRRTAPHDELIGPDLVRKTIRQAYARAGLPYTRSHLLRHTMAGRLLATGSSLKEVADVLRHRSLNTALVYAKLDSRNLQSVALPWPGMNQLLNLRARVRQYLRERRRLGFQLRSMGYALHSFARHVDQLHPCGALTLELMAEWARRDRAHSNDPHTWARRLKILRPFTRWLRQFEPHTEVPDDAVFGRVGQRLPPHIYSEQELVDLLAAARRLAPSLRGYL